MTTLPPPPGPAPLPPPRSSAPAPTGDFVNEPIVVDHLPQVDNEAFAPLAPRYRSGWLAVLAVMAAVAVVTGIVVALMVSRPGIPIVIAAAVAIGIAVLAALWNAEFRRLGYLVREHDVSLRSGVLTHREATVPFSRVQHVSVRRGPFERLLGLATVDVNSAGPDISIPGLLPDEAERIKQLITERSGADDVDR